MRQIKLDRTIYQKISDMSPTRLVILTIFVLLLDICWLTLSRQGYARLVKRVQGTPITIEILPALASYICVILAIVAFAIPMIETKTKRGTSDVLKNCFLYGGGLGFVIYGVFNFTNMAIFKNYDPIVAAKDTLWGVTLFTVSTYVYFSFLR